MDKIIDKIYFDFDSTLIKVESLDLLGERRGVGDEVTAMTARTMNGEVPFADVFREKMKLISPTSLDVEVVAKECIDQMVSGAKDVVNLLHVLNKQVYILSANFYPMILPLAKHLGLSKTEVIANEIFFDAQGNYSGFAADSFLSRDHGKIRMLSQEKLKGGSLALVGDSVSDLEAASVVDLFVGFGGVVRRSKVEQQAKHFVSMPSLLPILNFLLLPQEIQHLKSVGFEKLINQVQKLTTTTTTGTVPAAW